MSREGTEEASKAMDRFELNSLLGVTRGWGWKKLVENVVKADKQAGASDD